ncbi:guanine nucleotide-binding protein G(o) subunit alpha isoform X1 [Lingula anatina]|uniref:Guanine nucleotide-binding protein G(O) subunit alpha isoform X1 n=2 Tax=Lingula anatina TaxID=7574 RepID=A0A1S3IE60_LINAN|nr:guanine nucleotide-binding protein G(o) subunit alpha isoform X1 [Lingula anatina]|eukprot:XP_013396545.1 guanine nucleotide-binding protein G(o) subunit alpha isoform X1 [Lingula anatina]
MKKSHGDKLKPSDDVTQMSRKGAIARSRSIDHQLNEEREKREKEIQLLILGGGGSGKTTFMKQLRLHYGDKFPDEERRLWRPHVFQNVVDAFHRIISNMEVLGEEIKSDEGKASAQELNRLYPKMCYQRLLALENGIHASPKKNRDQLLLDLPSEVIKLQKDPGVKASYATRNRYPLRLSEAEEYFLNDFERICAPSYLPTIKDILFLRKPTVGVQEMCLTINSLNYRVIDVAGQKSQRNKWIHFFEGVTAVIFFVSLSGFNEMLEEDSTMNNLRDSLQTFQEMTHNQYLTKTDVMLFLNKHDLFMEKMKRFRLAETFPEFRGHNTPDDALGFIKDEFYRRAPPGKSLYTHVSCAINVDLMKTIIENVLQILVDINLRRTGLM